MNEHTRAVQERRRSGAAGPHADHRPDPTSEDVDAEVAEWLDDPFGTAVRRDG